MEFKEKTVLITAGGTQENIDPVRYIGNRSSGKMGIALAESLLAKGANIILVLGSHQVLVPKHQNLKVVQVQSAEDMLNACMSEFDKVDVVFKAAAVADFKVKQIATDKIKKQGLTDLTLTLEPTVDILKTLGANKKKQIIIGFALETNNAESNAQKKLLEKNIDAIVLNIPTEKTGFGKDTNQIVVLHKDGSRWESKLLQKTELATILCKHLEEKF
jgi:phosphopantothenoylcysteine decarboxylase/phosphopantothenate--cysteine ligase